MWINVICRQNDDDDVGLWSPLEGMFLCTAPHTHGWRSCSCLTVSSSPSLFNYWRSQLHNHSWPLSFCRHNNRTHSGTSCWGEQTGIPRFTERFQVFLSFSFSLLKIEKITNILSGENVNNFGKTWDNSITWVEIKKSKLLRNLKNPKDKQFGDQILIYFIHFLNHILYNLLLQI